MLDHPHTSAGRVPPNGLSPLRESCSCGRRRPTPLPSTSPAHRELDTALGDTEALARMTNLLAIVSAPSLGTTVVRHVELLRLQPNVVMAVVITSTGGVAKRLFVFDHPVDTGLVDWATDYLEETVTGLRLGARTLRATRRQLARQVGARVPRDDRARVHRARRRRVGSSSADRRCSPSSAARRRVGPRLVARARGALELLGSCEAARRRPADVRVGDELSAPALRSLALVAPSYGLANRRSGPSPCSGRRAWTTGPPSAASAARRWRSPTSSRRLYSQLGVAAGRRRAGSEEEGPAAARVAHQVGAALSGGELAGVDSSRSDGAGTATA